METVQEAIIAKHTWRSTEIDDYVTAFLTAGFQLMSVNRTFLNNDDVEDAFQPLDGSTSGAAIKQLLMAKIISPWRGNVESENIWGGMRRSSRKFCHGHPNPVYQLNVPLAREWLMRHGRVLAGRQAWQPELTYG